jgi:excisionase family DNA binding protein
MSPSHRLKEPPALLDVQQVADLLNCSTRHVYRLVSAGQMPAPCKIRALVRWHRPTIEQWMCGGCASVVSAKDNN